MGGGASILTIYRSFKGYPLSYTKKPTGEVIANTDLESNLVIIIIPLAFLLTSIFLFIKWYFSYKKTGGYFISTKQNLIQYQKNKIRQFSWEQFTGNITNNLKRVSAELKTGKMRTNKSKGTHFVHDKIIMKGDFDTEKVKNILKSRISSFK